jgi:two-component system phosphate regulon sensor histidine kinase PhoR
MEDYAQPWRVMQEVDALLMKTIPWSERLEQISHSLLRLLDSDAIWLLTAPAISGIACGIIKSPLTSNPNACVIFTDLAPPPFFGDSDSPMAQILRTGAPRSAYEGPPIQENLDNDLADALLQTLKIRPSLILPLVVGSEAVGVLAIASRDGPANILPTSVLQAIGEHLGVTLQSAYLRDASRRQAEALATLNQIAHTITSSLDIEEVIKRTMAGINQILDVEAGSLLLVDANTDELYFKITLRGEHTSITAFRLQMGQGIAGWVVARGLPALVNDVSTDSRFYDKIDEAIGFRTSSVLCAPLIVQGRPIGALELINKRQGYFTEDDQELLISMCASLAIALQNAGLYKEAQERAQRTTIVSDITTAINASSSLPQATQSIAAHLNRLIPFDYANICLLDDGAGYLNVYHLGSETEHGNQVSVPVPIEGSGLEWILEDDQARMMELSTRDELGLNTSLFPDSTVSQMVSVPMVDQNKVRGVINLISTQADAYSLADLDTLAQITPQLTVAIEKARLFREVEKERARLDAFLSSTTDLIIVVDSDQRIVLANPAAREVFGQRQEWENHQLSKIVKNEVLLDLFDKAHRHKATLGEVPLPDGRTFQAGLSPVSSGDEQFAGWVVAMQDVTYLKELDQMKTDFMNAVSHDLRSPLSGIAIATHMVSKMGQVNDQQQSLLENIEQRVAEMTELIDGMLDLARIEANIDMEMEPCAIAPAIAKVVNQLRTQIQDKELKVDLEVSANLPPVMGDAWRLRQVLSNLVNNSIKYTPAGGRITITASTGEDEIVVSVQDTGLGISLVDQPYIFDKFYRVGRPEMTGIKGAGLGLAIARSIVERLGGRIEVQSELNVGSTFSFALPIIQDAPD